MIRPQVREMDVHHMRARERERGGMLEAVAHIRVSDPVVDTVNNLYVNGTDPPSYRCPVSRTG